MAKFGGVSTAATGTITSNTASCLAFATVQTHVIVTNISAVRVYCKINDPAGAQLVSTTVFDFVLDAGDSTAKTFTIDDMDVKTIGVYMAGTSGVNAVGWPSYGI